MLPDNNLVVLVRSLLNDPAGRKFLSDSGYPVAPPDNNVVQPKISMEEIIAVLKLICAGASVACPIINSLG